MFFFCHVAKIANCLFIIEIAVSVHLKKFLDRIESVEIFFVSEKKNLPLFSETLKYGGGGRGGFFVKNWENLELLGSTVFKIFSLFLLTRFLEDISMIFKMFTNQLN